MDNSKCAPPQQEHDEKAYPTLWLTIVNGTFWTGEEEVVSLTPM